MADIAERLEKKANDPVAFMSSHFVAMVCEYETIADGKIMSCGVSVYSGFLIELHGVFFWVTAGHCLKDELDRGLSTGQLRIIRCRFMDCFGLQAIHQHPIPYHYELECAYYVDQPEQGLDFALIMLNDMQVDLFNANKLVAIRRDNWEHQHRLTFDFYRMLGVPADHVFATARPDGSFDVKVGQAMVAVNKIEMAELGEVPWNVEDDLSEDWFLGRLDPGCNIPDLKGMSGGPIYGFRKLPTGELLYHVVALQSRWWDKTRTIFGCALPIFAEEVYHQLSDFFEKLGDHSSEE